MKTIFIITIFVLITACSDQQSDNENTQKDHVWQTQTDALEKAKQVEQLLNDAMLKQQQEIERQTQ